MPDALSTTIPIWCTVINLALLPDHPLSSELHLPPYIARQTHSAIEALIPSFLESLKSLNISLPQCLSKPLRPFWITQDSSLPHEPVAKGDIFDDYRPVICCTASRRILGETEADEGGYIQGAADDTENWAEGLTPTIFWANAETLLKAAEADLPDMIRALVRKEEQSKEDVGIRRMLTKRISVCALPLSEALNTECQVVLLPKVTPKETWVKSKNRIEVGLGKGKIASKNLRLALEDVCNFVSAFLSSLDDAQDQITIACESGKDLSVGTGLAVHCYLFDNDGHFRVPEGVSFTKTFVKTALGRIMTEYPEANPSRSTLQAVNSFLMDWTR